MAVQYISDAVRHAIPGRNMIYHIVYGNENNGNGTWLYMSNGNAYVKQHKQYIFLLIVTSIFQFIIDGENVLI